MGKRAGEPMGSEADPLKGGRRPLKQDEGDNGDSEEESEDEFESEDEALGDESEQRSDDVVEGEHGDAMQVDQDTFIPGRHKLGAGETLSPDSSTYEMLHTLTTTWPCLSFDFLRDDLGDSRKGYPAVLYAVAGTQAGAEHGKGNELMVMKLSGLSRTHREDEDSSEDEDEEQEDAEPLLESKCIPMTTTTNRIRAHQVPPSDSSVRPTTLVATMMETGQVLIHDVTTHLSSLDMPRTTILPQHHKPVSTLRMHKATEGYALDWSPLIPQGKLLTGDNDGKVFVTTRTEGGDWTTDTRPYKGHVGSVEDIQWSPTERNVFGSTGSDGAVKIWDVRSKSHRPAISVSVSNTDVNVMSWSHQTAHLLATGAEDGTWAVWDLRQWKPATPSSGPSPSSSDVREQSSVAQFSFHKEQITSIEWHPQEDSVVAVAAADNTITLWDLAVELDDEESQDTAGVQDVPPQLLFLHYMDTVKECHWHPQIPGCVMATGGAGFGVFKTISV